MTSAYAASVIFILTLGLALAISTLCLLWLNPKKKSPPRGRYLSTANQPNYSGIWVYRSSKPILNPIHPHDRTQKPYSIRPR